MHTSNNQLYLGALKATELAQLYGTPLYVYEEELILKNIAKLKSCIEYEPKQVHFAIMANSNVRLLKLLKSQNLKIHSNSPADVFIAMKAGFAPEEIVFSGTNLDKQDFEYLIKNRIQINVDSIPQLCAYGELNPRSKIGLRINLKIRKKPKAINLAVGKNSRIGIPEKEISHAKRIAEKFGLKVNGIQTYLGSNILELEPFTEEIDRLIKLAEEFPYLEYIDFGGGFGIPYKPSEREFNWKKFGEYVTQKMNKISKKTKKKLVLIIEPGRSVIGEAGTLLTKVISIKANPTKTFIGVDTCSSHFQRPYIYNAYHEIVKANETNSKKKIVVDVCGNTTLSNDYLGKNRSLPKIKQGDILAILNAGAYGYSMSSHFLNRPRPAEILVSGDNSHIIREKETFEDLL